MQIDNKGRAVAVGNFDGIHLGHIYLLNKLKEEALRRNLEPLVITFDPHPAEVLKNREDFCKLSTGKEKKELIETKLGIRTEVINFTEEFSVSIHHRSPQNQNLPFA